MLFSSLSGIFPRSNELEDFRSYLYSGLRKSDPHGYFLSHENIWVVCFGEAPLQFVELGRREPGPVSLLLCRFVRIGGVSALPCVLLGQTALVAQTRCQSMSGIHSVVQRSVFYVVVRMVPLQLIAQVLCT